MRPFFLLFLMSVFFFLGDGVSMYLLGESRGDFFFVMILLFLLPGWFAFYRYIERTSERKGGYLSIFQGLFLLGIALLSIGYFHATLTTAIAFVLFFASLFSLLDPRVLFLFSLLLVVVIPLSTEVNEKYIVNAYALFAFYFLVFGVLGSMWAPSFSRLFSLRWMRYSPPEWELYLAEIQKIFAWYLKYGIYLVFASMIYILGQDSTWIFYLHSSVPVVLVLFFYFSFLCVPIQGKEKNLLRIKF